MWQHINPDYAVGFVMKATNIIKTMVSESYR